LLELELSPGKIILPEPTQKEVSEKKKHQCPLMKSEYVRNKILSYFDVLNICFWSPLSSMKGIYIAVGDIESFLNMRIKLQ